MAVPGYVCFAAQDWWYHNQSHSDFQLMRNVARRRQVLVVNSLGLRAPTPGRSTTPLRRIGRKARSVARGVRAPLPELPGFCVMSPVALPAYGPGLVARGNAAAVAAQVGVVARRLGMHRPVCVVTLPTAEPVVARLDARRVVANRSDKHSEFAEADRSTILGLEERLVAMADDVLYTSHALMEEERDWAGGKARFFDHGVDVDHFARRASRRDPADLSGIPHPRVGFFGAVDDLVDLELVGEVAGRLPDTQFVMVGAVSVPVGVQAQRPNVHFLGRRPYEEIPAYAAGFDLAMMAWRDVPWIRWCNPIKLKEYLALGLPVVSTPFPELDGYRDVVAVASGAEAFAAAVERGLGDRHDRHARAARAAKVADQTWARRADELIELCEGSTAPCVRGETRSETAAGLG